MNDTRPTAEQVLAELGAMLTPEVTATLIAARAVGQRNSPWDCPVARYVRERSGREVELGSVTWMHRDDVRGMATSLPQSVRVFILAFDTGKIPALEEGNR